MTIKIVFFLEGVGHCCLMRLFYVSLALRPVALCLSGLSLVSIEFAKKIQIPGLYL